MKINIRLKAKLFVEHVWINMAFYQEIRVFVKCN